MQIHACALEEQIRSDASARVMVQGVERRIRSRRATCAAGGRGDGAGHGVAGLLVKVKEDEARKYKCASPASADKDLARVFQSTWRALGRKVVKLGMEAVFVRGARVSDLMSQIRLTTDDESCTMSL